MIFFDHARRNEFIPPVLKSSEVEDAWARIESRMSLSEPERRQSDVPPVWKLGWGIEDPINLLERLTHGRCAFCELKNQDLHVYRFRPPGYAEPTQPIEGKDSYLWLAFAWSNFFPICDGCRPKRPNFFPVEGDRAPWLPSARTKDPGLKLDEQPLLLFPGELARPWTSFQVTARGELLGNEQRAVATIMQYNLNRPDIVPARAHHFDEMVRSLVEDRWVMALPDEKTFLMEEFGGTKFLFLRRLVTLIGRMRPDMGRPSVGNPDALGRTLARWRDQFELGKAVTAAMNLLRSEDEGVVVRIQKTPTGAETPVRDHPPVDRDHSPIRSVAITTYKSLETIAFDLPGRLPAAAAPGATTGTATTAPEAPCLLVLGENSTGKSSILEAVALTCLSPQAGRRLKLDASRLTLNPEYMGSADSPAEPESRIHIAFHDGTTRTLRIDGRGDAASPFRWKPAREGPLVFAYGAHRLFGARRRQDALRHVDTLFRNDRQLSNPEEWLRELATGNPPALDEVVSALRHIIRIDGEFESIEFPPGPDPDTARGIIRLKKKRPDGTTIIVPQPLSVVSSGFRAVLALVCDILDGLLAGFDGSPHEARMSRAIVLIDEIEAHLHPRWKLQIIAGLRRALPRVTFLMTSHDPLCVRGMFNGEVIALNRYHNAKGEGLGLPERVERVAGFDQVETMTIDQLLTSDLFQLLSADDEATERDLAAAADTIARRPADSWTAEDRAQVDRLNDLIGSGLPVGRNEVTRLVQEAVAEFLLARRQSDAAATNAARDKAKQAVRAFLEGLAG